MFDPSGKLLSVYHKYNLWTSELDLYDIDATPQLEYVDTPFGRLGFIICEDLLWGSPTVDLVDEAGVDTLIVPLSWWDMYPHQLAHVDEMSWARGLQVIQTSIRFMMVDSINHGPICLQYYQRF